MRVFVLCTGRCGSMTLSKALSHATNYTTAHETHKKSVRTRLDYPDNHIEVDNRLSFFLGLLHKKYPEAFYIWLRRDRAKVIDSYAKRFNTRAGIMNAYARGVIQDPNPSLTHERKRAIAELYTDATEANIEAFCNSSEVRSGYINMDHTPAADLKTIWRDIGAEGDLDAALRELGRFYNASKKA